MAFVKTDLPCPVCDSSDAFAIDDGGWGRCFSCLKTVPPEQASSDGFEKEEVISKMVPLETNSEPVKLASVVYRSMPDRDLSKQALEFYGVGFRGTDIVFPYNDGKALKVRKRGDKKQHGVEGDWKADTALFGQHLYPKGGKFVLITEGEFDAVAAYELMSKKTPCVSVRNGASGAVKDVKANYEWLDTFDSIVVCFDSDEAGTKAANEVATVFGHKAKIMKHAEGLKDANDYLTQQRQREFVDRFWKAEQWTPEGIINFASMYDDVMAPLAKADCDYPWSELNKLTYGIRNSELVTVTAGSGLGKSQFLREIIWHLMQDTSENIGLIFLEESGRKTGLSLMSLAANKPLHLPDTEATQEEKDDAYTATLGSNRLFGFPHFGSHDIDSIVSTVRYLAKGCDCKYIFLDHISIVVSAQSNGDERKAIDEIMTKLRMLVQETGISLFCVSHLKRPENKGHEEGAATSLAQLRGSGSIAQLSDMVLGLERNGQADDEMERNTTKVRVLKNRFSGTTGPAGRLLYDHKTGRMTERLDIEDEAL
jgi:twinkle protein